MPYSVQLKKAVLCPPKCGTTSIQHCFKHMGLGVPAQDHRTMSDMVAYMEAHKHDPLSFQWAMNVRHPFKRLQSALNAKVGQGRDTEHAFEDAASGNHIIFAPQASFIDMEIPVHLFDFETMDLVRWLGWGQTPPHLNQSRPRLSEEEIKAHRLYPEIMARYDADWKLYERIEKQREGRQYA